MKTCLVTGTTHGIGRATAHALAARGLRLVMACRDLDSAGALKAELIDATGNREVHVLGCDLASLASVRDAVAEFEGRFDALHLLINNAGTMLTRHRLSEDGYELTFAVNYLGPYLLTRLLLPRLTAAGRARIVNVASQMHVSGAIDVESLRAPGSRRYHGMQAYSDSKLGNVMFTLSLAERLPADIVTANCLHPGVVATNIMDATNALLRVGMRIATPFMRSPVKGAGPTLHLALDEALAGVTGRYFDERLRMVQPAQAALDRAGRDALWRWSASACGVQQECGVQEERGVTEDSGVETEGGFPQRGGQ